MYVKNIAIEDGFLNGLDLDLKPGLVVLIGARGAGKTSIVELIRFCLGGQALVGSKGDYSRKQALAVLASGSVTVTLDVDGQDVTFTRSASEDRPRRSSDISFPSPLILSQNEIEEIGRIGDSRLKLLDEFLASVNGNGRSEMASRSLIASLTFDVNELSATVRSLKDVLQELENVPELLETARQEAAQANLTLDSAKVERDRLSVLGGLVSSSSARLNEYEAAQESLTDFVDELSNLESRIHLPDWPDSAGPEDMLALVRSNLVAIKRALAEATDLMLNSLTQIQSLTASETPLTLALEDESRSLRIALDQLSEGAGSSLKKVNDLEASFKFRLEREFALNVAQQKLEDVRIIRDKELDNLDQLRNQRVNYRESVAAELNSIVGPNVHISVSRAGSTSRYAEVLAGALKGKSGLQHNVIAPILAESVGPRELVWAVENNDVDFLSSAAGISKDRASRVISKLIDEDLGSILTVEQDDTVQFSLLDGGEYKNSDELSVGQRCTAILPIVLSHSEKILIVDQPEDNLDNSFVADTLVRVLLKRKPTSQIIFATHNPNIPVLGDADQVVFLQSDGRRGEVASSAPLDDIQSVRAITDIMEGGQEAFDERARFYKKALS